MCWHVKFSRVKKFGNTVQFIGWGKMFDNRIALIGGGNMGEALAAGMVKAQFTRRENILVAEPVPERREYLRKTHGLEVIEDGKTAVSRAEVILFAVKPQVIDHVIFQMADAVKDAHLLISIIAGMPTKRFVGGFGAGTRIIRVMPNTPALVGAGAAGLCKGGAASEADLDLAKRILESVGRVVEVPEALMDAVTGLSGSGPAYVFQFIEALADGGVRVGLPRDQAILLAAQTVLGSAKMLLETGKHPGVLKDMVTSPGGTTIAGLHALEKEGLRAAVMAAVMAATKRSEELGKG